MRRVLLGLLIALAVHGVVFLFGGLLFLKSARIEEPSSAEIVDLVSDEEDKEDARKKESQPEADAKESAEEPIETPDPMPDLKQLAALEAPAAAPALEALSLSALEDVLDQGSAAGADGAFGFTADLASGGRIGGSGKPGAAASELESAFSITELDQKPKPIVQVVPQYPVELRRRKIEGSVSVLFVVDEGGRVVDPRIERSSEPSFDGPALAAVKQWKFEPAVKDGRKVRAKMRVPVRFSLS